MLTKKQLIFAAFLTAAVVAPSYAVDTTTTGGQVADALGADGDLTNMIQGVSGIAADVKKAGLAWYSAMAGAAATIAGAAALYYRIKA